MTDMNKSMLDRLRTAAGYQKQAIRALLPEGMEGHLDVIEKELKVMFAEIAAGVMAECRSGSAGTDTREEKQTGSVKKVTIE